MVPTSEFCWLFGLFPTIKFFQIKYILILFVSLKRGNFWTIYFLGHSSAL
jgi:hypothetical protein